MIFSLLLNLGLLLMLEINSKVPPIYFTEAVNKSEWVTYSKDSVHICLINECMDLCQFTSCLCKKTSTKLVVTHLTVTPHDIFQVFYKIKAAYNGMDLTLMIFFNPSRIFFHKNNGFPIITIGICVVFSVIRQLLFLLISAVISNLGYTLESLGEFLKIPMPRKLNSKPITWESLGVRPRHPSL